MTDTVSDNDSSPPQEVAFTLGGHAFTVKRLPWGICKRVTPALVRVGAAIGTGRGQNIECQEDIILALHLATGMAVEQLEQLPATPLEIDGAVNELIRITGLDVYQRTRFEELRAIQNLLTATASLEKAEADAAGALAH